MVTMNVGRRKSFLLNSRMNSNSSPPSLSHLCSCQLIYTFIQSSHHRISLYSFHLSSPSHSIAFILYLYLSPTPINLPNALDHLISPLWVTTSRRHCRPECSCRKHRRASSWLQPTLILVTKKRWHEIRSAFTIIGRRGNRHAGLLRRAVSAAGQGSVSVSR